MASPKKRHRGLRRKSRVSQGMLEFEAETEGAGPSHQAQIQGGGLHQGQGEETSALDLPHSTPFNPWPTQAAAQPLGHGPPEPYLSSFPAELVVNIAEYLYPGALLHLSRTCSRFYRLLSSRNRKDLWETSFQKAWPRELWTSLFIELTPGLAAFLWDRICLTKGCDQRVYCPIKRHWTSEEGSSDRYLAFLICGKCREERLSIPDYGCLSCRISAEKRDGGYCGPLTADELLETVFCCTAPGVTCFYRPPLCVDCFNNYVDEKTSRAYAFRVMEYLDRLIGGYCSYFGWWIPIRERSLIRRYELQWPGGWLPEFLPYLRARPLWFKHIKGQEGPLTNEQWADIADDLRGTVLDIAFYCLWCLETNVFNGEVPIPSLPLGPSSNRRYE